MYARDVAAVTRAYADCGEGAPGHGSIKPLVQAAMDTAASMHPVDAQSTLSALRKMGGGDGKTRKALEAAASATSDQAMGLRRSLSPKEKRDAKRGDE